MKSLNEYIINEVKSNEINYYNKLSMIDKFPSCLFYKGNINLINSPTLAIIGCRKCSKYGKEVAINLSYRLAKSGMTIISGGARGIDSFSILGAIAAGKPTIIVLGNGLNYIYPSENKELEEKVLENGGLLLSEYEVNKKPDKNNFPQRNKIISAISDGLLIVEAKEKSGTFITVDYALNFGKNIYAIPGNINSKNSFGTNELIKQGAKPVTRIQDILEDFY